MMQKLMQSSLFLLLLAFSLFHFSCSEKEPTSPDKEHFKAYGFILETSGVVYMKVFKGQLDPQYNQYIEVTAGTMTDHLEIIFLDENGQEIKPPTDKDHSFSWNIADTNIAKVHRHGDEWEFHVVGVNPGETTIEFLVLHNDHPDFRSPKIKIKVNPGHIAKLESFKIVEEDTNEVLVFVDKNGNVEGEIIIEYPEKTDHLVVVFYDVNDNKVALPSPPYTLKLKFSDETIVKVDIEHWEFIITPLNYGSTSFRVMILENDKVKYNFMGEVPVKVQ